MSKTGLFYDDETKVVVLWKSNRGERYIITSFDVLRGVI